MSKGRLCDVRGCDAPATHRAEVVIYAAAPALHRPAIGYLGIRVCAAHADDEHAAALLSDAGKRQIEQEFAKAGRARPAWSRSFVRWVALSEEPKG